jgi:hypothetical protein
MKILIKRLEKAFNLTSDLVNGVSDDALKSRLKTLRSNTIGQQIWCMIGARESYLKAIVNNGWAGFSCSLKDTTSKAEILQCLQSSARCLTFLNLQELNEAQAELAITLLEHEILHHGQLIRYFYGNDLAFPKSWKERYTV